MGFLIYFAIGVIWGLLVVSKHYYDGGSSEGVEQLFIANVLLWWLMMIVGVAKWLAK